MIVRKQELDNHDPQTFDIEVEGQPVQVTVHKIKSAKVFHLVFKGKRRALNVTVGTDDEGGKFWTSVPEGRQEEAELAGKVIATYLRDYRRTQICATITDKKLAAPSLFD